MALIKVMGIETEYGITVKRSAEFDPVAASTLVVNSYKDRAKRQVAWDYEQENPLMDARGFQSEPSAPPPDEESSAVINDILTNGGRYYVDHAHPEYCTPECTNARDLLIYDKAGELILELSARIAEQTFDGQREIIIYKNNSDRKGHSYGCHENYLVDRRVPFQTLVDVMTPFLVTRQIFTGSGKVGAENGTEPCAYQISQRADFFETEVGLSTMVDRPIINTRDEPHADEKQYRRFHVIVGDANMAELSTYLKVGTTALVLQMVEDGLIGDEFKLRNPVAAIKQVSRDLTCKRPLELVSGRRMSAVQIQREFQQRAARFVESRKEESPYYAIEADVVQKWGEVLDKLEEDPMLLRQELDWVIKYSWLLAYQKRHGLSWDDHRVAMLDLQYHDIRPNVGIYHRLLKAGHVKRLVSEEAVIHAITNPPLDTRAYFRGLCLKRFASEIHAASWNSLIFDVDGKSLQKVPMPNPLRGTQELVGELMQRCRSAAELLQALEGGAPAGPSNG
ncbi:MAG: proteasome accessory factor PafA2 [Candidatus Poribacteria bacterium]|nr:MAG: proteasome accessory factor PafA2 [Candidatus Poribacteria bacterium]